MTKMNKNRGKLVASRPNPMALEARIMFDAAAVATADPVDKPAPEAVKTVCDAPPPADLAPPATVEAAAPAREILFIDTGVKDWQQLAAGAREGVQVVLLDPTRDGVQQITEALAGRSGLEAVHIVSHGSEGAIILGTAQLSAATLETYRDALRGWAPSLTADADLLIYGCDVASGASGQDFVGQLADLTTADVAASTDATGAAALGGNWTLEIQSGAIESSDALVAQARDGYDGLLAVVTMATEPVFNDTSANDSFSAPTSGAVSGTATSDLNGTGAVIWDVTGSSSGSYTVNGGSYDKSRVGSYGTFYINSTTGAYLYVPNAANMNAASSTVTDSFSIVATKNSATTTPKTWTATINGVPESVVNSAPVLADTTLAVSVSEGAGAPVNGAIPAGAALVSTLTGGITDADGGAKGIAVVGADASKGTWYYTTNNGTTWSTVGSVSSGSALLLADNATTRLYFAPNSGVYGSAGAALTIRAWDATSGTAGSKVDTSASGGSSAFSSATDTVSVAVKPTYSLTSPDSKFNVLQSGVKYDPINDTQSNAADTDLVGDTNYALLMGGYDSNSGEMYFRVRIGDPTLSKGTPVFTGVVLLGVDTNGDGKLDVFVGVDGRNNGLGVVTFAPGSGDNISPSTTSITAPIAATGTNLYNYVSATGDLDGDGKTDAYLTFKMKFSDLASRVQQLSGQSITASSSLGFVLLTMTQNNSINGDIGGIGAMTKAQKETSYRDLGLLQPINFSAPSLGAVSGTVRYVENASGVQLSGGATIADLDSPDFNGGKLSVSIASNASAGDTLVLLNTGGVSTSGSTVLYNGVAIGTWTYSANTLTVSFTASTTLDQLQAVTRAVGYSNSGDAPATDVRGVQFVLTDPEGHVSDASTVSVVVEAVNDAPTLSVGAMLNRTVANKTQYAIGTATTSNALILGGGASQLSVSDVDAGTGNIQVTLGVSGGILELYSGTTLQSGSVTIGSVTITGSSSGSLVLTGSVANINALLAGSTTARILYQPGSIETGTVALTMTVNDLGNTGTGGAKSSTASVGTITVNSPAVTGTLAGSVIEDNGVQNGKLAVSGTVSATVTGATFLANSTGGSAIGAMSYSGTTWTYTVSNSAAAVQALAAGQVIRETYQITAGGTAYVTVTIQGVNDAPTLSVTTSSPTFIENGSAVSLFSGAAAGFGAGETGQSFRQLNLTVSNVADGDQLIIDGKTVYIDASASGIVTGHGYTLTVGLSNGVATVAISTGDISGTDLQNLVNGMKYASASDNPTASGAKATRTVTLSGLQDTGGTANSGSDTASLSLSTTVQITAVNDAPVLNSANIIVNQNSSIVVGSGYLLATDPDTGSANLVYTVTSGPGKGVLLIDGSAVSSFTQKDIDDGRLSYRANPYGTDQADSFVVSVSDGTASVTNKTVGISIITANFAPSTADNIVSIPEDTPYVFGSADFAFNDANSGDSLSKVSISALPSAGKLQYNDGSGWVDVTAIGQMLSAADIAGGKLRFLPASDAYSSPYASFDFKVYDQSNAASSDARVTINVTPVNDAPTAGALSITTNEDTARSGSLPAATDAENDAVTYTKASDPSHGTVVVGTGGSYTYTPSANYNGPDSFTYTVSDGKGGSNTYTVSITVDPVNDAPTAAGTSITTNEDTPKSGSLPAASDVDNDTVIYTKASDPSHGSVVVSTDGSYTYTPAADYNGTDSFTYTVSDGKGGSNTYTASITVNPVNDAPTAGALSITTNEDTAKSGNLPAATDVENDAVTYTKASDPSYGTVVVNASGSYTYTPSANYSGPDSFTYTVSDGKGGSNTYTVSITVDPVNDAPTAGALGITTNEDTIKSGNLPMATDADSDTVTYSKASDPSHGTVLVGNDGSYTYTPSANYNGPDSFTYSVSDGKGGSNTYTVSITVNPVNDVPTAGNDSIATNEDTASSGNLPAANDADGDTVTYTKASDPSHGAVVVGTDGSYTYTPAANYNGTDSFTYTVSDGKGGGNTYTVNIVVGPVNDAPTAGNASITMVKNTIKSGNLPTATDTDNDAVTYAKSSDPAHGTVTVDSDGGYLYTPVANYSGTDSFTYTVSDGKGGSNTYTVSIAVDALNDAPTAGDDSITTNEDTTKSGNLPAANDADGDTVTYTKASDPSHGTVVVDTDGGYTYTPFANYNGADSFTYTVSDGQGASNAYTVNITVSPVNDAPVAGNDSITTNEDTAKSGSLPAATDADSDTVTYTKASDPSHGTVVVGADGSYTYTPSANYNGSDSFTYTVSDGKGGSNTYTVSITVDPVNDAPTAAAISITTNEDTIKSGNLPTATDADSDTVTYTKASDPSHGTVVVGADGSYTYTPAANYNGTDSFTYTVSDGKGGSNTYTVSITVDPVNDAPTAGNDSITTNEDTIKSGNLPTATDADSDTVTYTKASDPSHGTVVVGADGSYTYTPSPNYNGSDSFTYTVSDGKGGSNTYTVSITVDPVNDAPTAGALSITTNEDTIESGNLPAATDADSDTVTYTKASDPSHGTVVVGTDGSYTYTPAANYNGTDSFTYTVSDGKGGSNTYTVSITVDPVNDAPTAGALSITTNEDTIKSGNLPVATDVDSDTVTYAKASDPSHGTVVVGTDGSYTYTPSVDYNGPDSFTYTVSDGKGGSNTYTVSITVSPVNDAPAAANASISTNEDTIKSGSLPAATDADSDSVTYAKASDPSHGTVEVGTDGSYTYTPSADYNGPDSFTYTVSDGKGGSNTYTVSITVDPVNDAPAAANASISTNEDTIKSGSLPAATDADSDSVTYTKASDPSHGTVIVGGDGSYTYTPSADYNGTDSFTYTVSDGKGGSNTYTVSITVDPVNDAPAAGALSITTNEDTIESGNLPAATDVDSDTVTYTKASDPSHGMVVVGTDGSYTYTPAANYNGTDSFTYTVSDGKGGSNAYTVSITVDPVNDAPTAAAISITTNEDTIKSGNLPAATDADSDTVTYTKASDPSHGTVIVGTDGSYTYTPSAEYNGTDSFTYTVSDGKGGSNTYTVSITVDPVNDAPTAANAIISTNENTARSGSLPSVADVDNDPATYAKAADPSHGTVVVNPDGSYVYTPAASYNGTDSFTYTVSDGKGGSNTYTVSITVAPVNDAPTAANATVTTSEDTAVTGRLPVAADVDNDAVTYAKGGDPSHGTVVVNADGSYTYTPAPDYNGPDSFAYTVSDGKGGSNTYVVQINVTPVADPTEFAGGQAGTVVEDVLLASSGRIIASDRDGETAMVAETLAGTHGVLVIDASGAWQYRLDNGATIVQNMNTADTVVDRFIVRSLDGTQTSVAITVRGTDDPVPVTPPAPAPAPVPAPVPTPVPPVEAPAPAPAPSPAPAAAPVDPRGSTVSMPSFSDAASSVNVGAAPGSLVGNDASKIVFGPRSPVDAPIDIQVRRNADLSDVYTRSEGFRTVVAKAEEPALVVFRGVPDQYTEAGNRLSLTVPADAFAHTQPKEVVRLAATLQDGRPLPTWVQFNAQTGQFTGEVPPGTTGELRIKVIARDMQGREASALFRVNIGNLNEKAVEAVKAPGKLSLSDQLRQSSMTSRHAERLTQRTMPTRRTG